MPRSTARVLLPVKQIMHIFRQRGLNPRLHSVVLCSSSFRIPSLGLPLLFRRFLIANH